MNSPKPTREYMFLFRGSKWDEGISPEEIQKRMDQVMAWFEGLRTQGRVKGAQPLAAEGQTISGKNGAMVLDGPFAESKEAVGGYLLLEAADFAEALAIARTCPTLEHGTVIEVRPVLDECPVTARLRERTELAAA